MTEIKNLAASLERYSHQNDDMGRTVEGQGELMREAAVLLRAMGKGAQDFADVERERELMAKDWGDFCEAMGVAMDTQEAVAFLLLAERQKLQGENELLQAERRAIEAEVAKQGAAIETLKSLMAANTALLEALAAIADGEGDADVIAQQTLDETIANLPACGCDGKAELISGGPGNHYLRCTKCGIATDDGSIERAVRLWNKGEFSAP